MAPKSHSRAPEPAPKVQRDAGPTSGHRHLVSRVDDDASVRRALQRLVESAGFAVETFASGCQLLDFGGLARTACLVIDVHLGDMIGFELRRTLITGGVRIPTIFITAYDDEATHQCAKRAGAVSYLTKPLDGQVLAWAL